MTAFPALATTIATATAPTRPAAPAPDPRDAAAMLIGPYEIEATGIGPVEFEATPIGPQALVTGVAPITPRDRLVWRANAPMQPKKPQCPADHGLFDTNARNQMEMFG
jgi:hypothetical protein